MLTKFFRICSVIALFFMLSGIANACVGRILYIGALDTDQEKVMAELLVLLINERTGTNVKIRYFDNNDLMYAALKAKDENERIDIIIENTIDALAVLQQARSNDIDQEFTLAKEEYEKKLDVIWLSPFGYKNGTEAGKSISAPLVRRDVLTNFPLLPRVLNKLSDVISDQVFTEFMSKAKKGDKAKNIAKDFLKAKKFI